MVGVDPRTTELFEQFASECPKDRLEPADWLRFCEFLIHVHAHSIGGVFMPMMTYELQSRGFDPSVIEQISVPVTGDLVGFGQQVQPWRQ